MLYVGGVLAIFIGLAHSYLGEKYILIRLFRRDNLPKLFGGDWFTKRVLRFAWHLTTIAWWGFGGILFLLSEPDVYIVRHVLLVIATVFFVSGVLSASFTRGRHISWVVFWAISGLSFYRAIAN